MLYRLEDVLCGVTLHARYTLHAVIDESSQYICFVPYILLFISLRPPWLPGKTRNTQSQILWSSPSPSWPLEDTLGHTTHPNHEENPALRKLILLDILDPDSEMGSGCRLLGKKCNVGIIRYKWLALVMVLNCESVIFDTCQWLHHGNPSKKPLGVCVYLLKLMIEFGLSLYFSLCSAHVHQIAVHHLPIHLSHSVRTHVHTPLPRGFHALKNVPQSWTTTTLDCSVHSPSVHHHASQILRSQNLLLLHVSYCILCGHSAIFHWASASLNLLPLKTKS